MRAKKSEEEYYRELCDCAKEIVERVPAKEAAEYYGLEFNRGNKAHCPFHNEKTPSFSVKEKSLRCFGCGWQGNIIHFVEKYYGLEFVDALKKIDKDFGLRIRFPLLYKKVQVTDAILPDQNERGEIDRDAVESEFIKAVEEFRQSALQALWDEWFGLDRTVIDTTPTDPAEPISDEYADALKHRDYISYLIDEYNVTSRRW